jgi:uncharacterized protein (UPF0210 family)
LKIRSITYFFNPGWPIDTVLVEKAGSFIAKAKPSFESAGFEVQTTRLATTPFPLLLGGHVQTDIIDLARQMEILGRNNGYNYVSLGPAIPLVGESYDAIPEVLNHTQSVFLSGIIASQKDGISLKAVRACARIIQECSVISPDGFTNLRFAALANVPPGSPFFPAGYHNEGGPSFALATEAADLAVDAFRNATTIADAKMGLINSVESLAQIISTLSEELAGEQGLKFGGIDFSLAPFPKVDLSIGEALERLGIQKVGMHGSLAGAAFITDALEKATFKRAGFNGLFLPLLEDSILAERASEGLLGINELMLYSAVCGTGLDTLPLPGNTSIDQLSAVLLDLAALAMRLDKPLTARLMPVPGKKAGDMTNFDFPYFNNSRILPVLAAEVKGILGGDENIELSRRSPSAFE